jgi:protein SCO1
LEEVGGDAESVQVAMVSVDPERDTPEVMNAYLGSFVGRYRVFRPDTAEQLAAAETPLLASSSVDKHADGVTGDDVIVVEHSGTAYVIDDQGEVRVEWLFGTGVDAMVNDLSLLLDEASTSSQLTP